MTGVYAKETTVPVAKTRQEIETVLARYGATEFASGWDSTRALVGFRLRGRLIRFVLRFPTAVEFALALTKERRRRPPKTKEQIAKAYDQLLRQRWRALLLTVKAKLESVESEIETVEEAFLPQIVLPGGRTVAEELVPQLEEAYRTGALPRLLPGLPEGS